MTRQHRPLATWGMRLAAYTLLTAFALFMLFPFIYMITTSLKSSNSVFESPPRLLPYTQETINVAGEETPVYLIEVDGQIRRMIDTGEGARFGFFTTAGEIDLTDPRQSTILFQAPLEDVAYAVTAAETGEEITLTLADGATETFALYDVTANGETQRLVMAYRSGLDQFVDPTDPAITAYTTARTAAKAEYVDYRIGNYEVVFGLNLNRALVNTTVVTFGVVIGQLVTSIFGGYAFSRLRFRGRDTLFLVYLGSIMIPFVVLIIPMYRLMVLIGWQDQLVSLIVPWIFTAYGTFLLRQFFITIPKEIEEAALLDGASRMRILWGIFVPLSRPAIATLAIFSFLYAWNSFLWPLLIIGEGNEANHVLTLALIRLSNIAADRPNLVLTGAAIAILPPILVFMFAQRYFIEGVTSSAVKG